VIDDIFAATVILNRQSVARDAFRQLVGARRVALATHQGPYRGVAATGKRVKWTQISVVRFVEGRIVEDWAVADELSILQQLGQSTT